MQLWDAFARLPPRSCVRVMMAHHNRGLHPSNAVFVLTSFTPPLTVYSDIVLHSPQDGGSAAGPFISERTHDRTGAGGEGGHRKLCISVPNNQCALQCARPELIWVLYGPLSLSVFSIRKNSQICIAPVALFHVIGRPPRKREFRRSPNPPLWMLGLPFAGALNLNKRERNLVGALENGDMNAAVVPTCTDMENSKGAFFGLRFLVFGPGHEVTLYRHLRVGKPHDAIVSRYNYVFNID